MPAAGALTLADKISDPLMPEFDPSLLDFGPRETDFASKKDDPLVWNSQIQTEPSIEIGREAPSRDQRVDFGEDDMNIDLDLDFGGDDGPSIEIGRNAPPTLHMDDDLIGNDLISKDIAFEDGERTRLSSQVPSLIEDRDDQLLDNMDMHMDDGDEFAFPADEPQGAIQISANPRLQRDSQSPLSSIPSDGLDNRDATHVNERHLEDSTIHQATQKAKKRKVLQSDSVTMLTSDTIKKQQADRSAILKPTSFLPRDQMLLNLMNLQRKGGFVSSLISDGPIKGLAPELRGILSIEVVRKSNQLKRKRDSETADAAGPAAQRDESRVQIDIPEDDTRDPIDDEDGAGDNGGFDLANESGFEPLHDDVDLEGVDAARDQFDETTAPLLHPMEQGAISQGTKHAVHLLRDQFRSSASGTPSQQKKASILFQELLPEQNTSKADATKMFFETLVLATKDAIKVEQADKEVGSNIRVRAKRGLWGAWAEKEAGGEIAAQEETPAVTAVA